MSRKTKFIKTNLINLKATKNNNFLNMELASLPDNYELISVIG